MGFKSHYHIAQTFSVAELPEHQSQKLVPAGQMLDITVTVILVNKMAELVIFQILKQLGEYVFVLLILQQFNLAEKVQIQIYTPLELLVKDSISAISKND
jgi:hypothetical protein